MKSCFSLTLRNAMWFLLPLAAVTAFAERPNIVFLLTDDQSFYTLGCYGNPDVRTPEIDRLASEGIAFDHYYTTTAICMASRATTMTGKYEFKTGCNFAHGDLMTNLWEKSYPVLLRKAGYQTAFAGKFGFELRDTPDGPKRGLPAEAFDRWGGCPGQTFYETAKNKSMAAYAAEYPHSTLAYGAFGRDFIRDAAKNERPFCLSISFKAPHRPATPDPRFDDVYRGRSFVKPGNYGREKGEHFAKQSRQGRQYKRFYEWHYADAYDEVMAIYHQQVYGIDVAVGMIRKALVDAGVDKNTVIIFTSDNGFFCGSHGYGSKVLPYEEASRVPLIIYDPRHPNSGKELRCDALCGNIDIAPTILRLAGCEIPNDVDGGDLMELYGNPNGSIHESIALINVWGNVPTHALAVVTRRMKYIFWGYAADGFEATEELYDLKKDPLELHNMVGDPELRGELQRMRKLYDSHLRQWQSEAVPYNGYAPYGVYFDREASWSAKMKAFSKLNWKPSPIY